MILKRMQRRIIKNNILPDKKKLLRLGFAVNIIIEVGLTTFLYKYRKKY